jgi:hypothetical protein
MAKYAISCVKGFFLKHGGLLSNFLTKSTPLWGTMAGKVSNFFTLVGFLYTILPEFVKNPDILQVSIF